MKFTIAYSLVFTYVISAIVFWGYSLNKQNKLIFTLEKEKIELLRKADHHIMYQNELEKIKNKKLRRTKQYLGEGSTFILITLLTSGIVYYAYYRQRALAKLQQNFMLSVTHELKTPIASIKLNMQTMEKRKLDEDTQKKLLASSITETNRLNDLCNNILVSTQLESAKKAMYNEEVDIKEVLNDVIRQIQERYPSCIITTSLMNDDFYIKGDTALWKLVVSNLIENARKYSSAPIEVTLGKRNKKTILSVKDQGVGIPDEEKEKIFDKFYRIGNENTRSSKGTGLGLFIVKKIVSLYKYDISVKNNTPKGSIFEVVFA
ncbi:signal transduction histidine-protein kinase ArlS [Filimonas sp.]|nr:signal transduction histidine-protein kinase ArlS [Filimonas sp.]